jgi:squalene-hopene/tetraprenyl-beta-curcumene cyclase
MTTRETEAGLPAGGEDGAIEAAAAAARRYLLSVQREDGHWCAELEGDTILESEYMLTMHFLGRAGEPRIRKAAEYLRRQQLPDGGWATYPGGPPEVSPRPRPTSP